METYFSDIKKVLKKILPKKIYGIGKFFYRNIKKYKYEMEVKKRSKYSIFEVSKLTKDMELFTDEYGYNAFYGYDKAVKKLLHWPQNIPIYGGIEHGFGYNNDLSGMDVKKDVIYVGSNWRRELYLNKFPKKIIICIGPVIQYFENMYDEQTMRIWKEDLGRTLLVMPPHSSHYDKAQYEQRTIIEEINRIKKEKNFDTVLVCVYWVDYLDGRMDLFKAEDYILCTAGHIYDYNFLPRLKAILTLCDMVFLSTIGTNVGFIMALNKPIYLFLEKWKKVNIITNEIQENEDMGFFCELEKEAEKLFGKYSEEITEEQIKFVRKYWGEW